MTKHISGKLYKHMIINGAAAISNNKQEINDLNVFPVPDGDTGTNMSLTISSAEKALEAIEPGTIGHTADISAGAFLRGARGNSGVILSLLFRGFSRHLKDVDVADAAQFAHALKAGVDAAYKAVMKPAEGTMLTVSRMLAAEAVRSAETESDIEKVLENALKIGYEALAETINQNPVLTKAGVIDAGGKGYLYIVDGMLAAMRGVTIEKTVAETSQATEEKADFSKYSAEDIKFAYCTEFMIEKSPKSKANRLNEFLDVRGDSVVVVEDDEIIKVHVHTNDPGVVLTEALTYGSLTSIKIENMKEQHTGMAADSDSSTKASAPAPKKPYAFVSVCAGDGIRDIFFDLGVDEVITGGQTMNPSTEDILEKVTSAPSDTVFVFPNNKNIIMAADQCVSLSDKHVVVIPTKSIPQCVSALLAVAERETECSADELTEILKGAIGKVRTAQITKAARNSVFDDTEIKKGSHLALLDDSLVASGADFQEVVTTVATKLCEKSPDFITVFTGIDAKKKETDLLTKIFSDLSGDAEFALIEGLQPVYRYIISAE